MKARVDIPFAFKYGWNGATSLKLPLVSWYLFCLALFVVACDSSSTAFPESPSTADCAIGDQTVINACDLPSNQIVNGGPGKDGIPALTNPPLVAATGINYLADSDRVIGLILDEKPVAIPHNILWWHEILNYDGASQNIAITYCPLTGSSIVFDRAAIGGAELGVSGLLYQNNLIMYDRNEEEALWSQMLSGARCSSSKGFPLETISHVEMSWGGWKAIHPDTQVLSGSTGHSRNYTQYPYGDYEEVNNSRLLFQMDAVDCRRPPKERVLGIPGDNGSALTFPFGLLDEIGSRAIVRTSFNGNEVVVLWDRDKESAVAVRPWTKNGESVTLEVVNGGFVDTETNSVFEVNGQGIEGELAGEELQIIDEAYVAFWFAWPAFHPRTELFRIPL